MEYLVLLFVVAALISPLFVIYKRHQGGKNVRGGLIANIASFFAMCVIVTVAFGFSNAALAAGEEAAVASDALATGLGYISAALAVGLSCIGGGIAVAAGASAALGALSENEGVFGKALIFVGLAEGVALYGLLVALMIISRL